MDAQSIAKASYISAVSSMWKWYYLAGLFLFIGSFELYHGKAWSTIIVTGKDAGSRTWKCCHIAGML